MADVTINDLTGQAPTTSDVFPFSTTGVTPSTYKATLAQIKTALAVPAAQVNSDWNVSSGVAQILNKPNIPVPVVMDVLVVGGGGSGGGGYIDQCGAGGAGGLINYTNYNMYPGTYYVTVGAGGYSTGGSYSRSNGQDSSIDGGSPHINITAIGGGAGAAARSQGGNSGGSGGGGGDFGGPGGSAKFGQGNNGGSVAGGGECPGGGGGAGGAGTGSCTGGAGLAISITGSSVTYAAGATAGLWTRPSDANTGSGGGGAGTSAFTSGAAGVVIFAYQGTGKASGGTVSTSSRTGWTVHTFTANGIFTVN
jgi:hypothetical protein